MWNLIPADPSFNSSKSDRLPPMDRYFDDFYGLCSARRWNIVKAAQPKKPIPRRLPPGVQDPRL